MQRAFVPLTRHLINGVSPGMTPAPTPTRLDTAGLKWTLGAHRPTPATVLDILAGSLVEVELISALEPAKLTIVVGAGGSVPFRGRRRVGI
jgi:hypothetical protein